jgi:heat shock protein HtpX
VIAYFFHQSIVDAVTGGEDVTRQQQPRLYNLLENLCISRGIPMPKLKIMQSDALKAFATGINRRQYAITVTSGLLRVLNDQEIEAVLGHELTHIRNGDVQMRVIAVIIAGVIGFFGELFFRMFTNLSWNSTVDHPGRPGPHRRPRSATVRAPAAARSLWSLSRWRSSRWLGCSRGW